MRRNACRRRSVSRSSCLFTLAAAAVALSAPSALANGRFPRSERLIEDPSNPDHLFLAATYGLLMTSDRGQHWYHICEAAFAGDGSYIGDPLLELVAGGVALVDVQATIRRSPDGCAWTSTFGSADAASQNVNDFAVDLANRTTVVAVVTRLVGATTSISLEQSEDSGLTWRAVGTPLPLASVATIDLDPTDATHVYATGLAPADAGDVGLLLKSLDLGTTWVATAIPNTNANNVPYIAAIDPRDPRRIFVRTNSYDLPPGAPEETANDALLYTTNGGASWSELLRESAKLLGFALSPDGTTILAGYGDPVESGYYVDPAATGIYLASTSSLSFSSVFSGSVTGLTWTLSGVYASTAQPASGTREDLAFFANGDLVPDGAAPSYVMKLSDIRGPPPCCAGVAAACDWPSVCATYPFFSCADDAGVSSDVCSDAGTPAHDSAAGDAPFSDAAPPPLDAPFDASAAAGAGVGSGCSCRSALAPVGVSKGGLIWVACLIDLIASRRRSRAASAIVRRPVQVR
jgi:hypothetical protein